MALMDSPKTVTLHLLVADQVTTVSFAGQTATAANNWITINRAPIGDEIIFHTESTKRSERILLEWPSDEAIKRVEMTGTR